MRPLSIWAWCLLCVGCSSPPGSLPEPGPRLVVHDARLDAGAGLVVHAARATVDDAGAGRASDVRAVLQPQASGGEGAGQVRTRPALEVEAPSSDWDLRTGTVRFSGGVVATRGLVQLTCAELEVVYADADRIDTAVASGDVLVVRGERRASGDQAVLTAGDGSLALTGSPSVTDGPNTLTGSRIVLYLDDERVLCDDCRLVVAGSAIGPR